MYRRSVLERFHEALVGSPPNKIQAYFYRQYESGVRGYSYVALDPKRFMAVFVTALWLAGRDKQRVYFLCPPVARAWVVAHMRGSVRAFVRKHRKNTQTVQAIQEAVQRLLLGGRILQLRNEPERWLAYGFGSDTPVPEWLNRRLLTEDFNGDR